MVYSIMSWSDFIVSITIVVLMTGTMIWVTGCSTKDNDIKTSQCRLKLDFNCDCKKDSSILTNVGEEINNLKD